MTKNRILLIYTFAFCVSFLLATFIFICIPNKYAARIEISDEPQEMDINIGLTHSTAIAAKENKLNDPDIYSNILGSFDFIKTVSKIKLDTIYYSQYLLNEEKPFWGKLAYRIPGFRKKTDEEIYDKIKHSIRLQKKRGVLLICVKDASPINAVKIADSVVTILQKKIISLKLSQTKAKLQNARNNYRIAKEEYYKSLAILDKLTDSTYNASLPSYETKIKEQAKIVSLKKELLNNAIERLVRLQTLTRKSSPSFATVSNATVAYNATEPSFILCLATCSFIMLLLAFWYVNIKNKKLSFKIVDFGDWFSPWSITIIVWILIVIFVKLEGNKLYPLTSQFYISISLWAPILCIVAFVTFIVLQSQSNKNRANEAISANNIIYNVLFYTTLLLTPAYFWQVYKVVSQFDTTDMMNNIRLLATHGDGVGLLKYTVVINQSLFLVSIWRYPKIPLWKLLTVYTCNIVCALSLMEKGSLFMLAFCTLFVLYEKGKIKLRTIAFTAGMLVILAFAFNDARESTNTSESNMDFMDFFGMYITSPPVAFSRLAQDLSGQIGTNTFEVFYDFLNRFGIGNFNVLNKEQEFVMVPVVTNVYTVMQPFYVDFGYGGVAFFAAVYGLFSGTLYHFCRKGNATSKCLYTFLVQILILQFYQENIFMSISGLTQLIILVTLMTQNKITLFSPKYVQR